MIVDDKTLILILHVSYFSFGHFQTSFTTIYFRLFQTISIKELEAKTSYAGKYKKPFLQFEKNLQRKRNLGAKYVLITNYYTAHQCTSRQTKVEPIEKASLECRSHLLLSHCHISGVIATYRAVHRISFVCFQSVLPRFERLFMNVQFIFSSQLWVIRISHSEEIYFELLQNKASLIIELIKRHLSIKCSILMMIRHGLLFIFIIEWNEEWEFVNHG